MSNQDTRFFLPPDDYEILRFGGESIRNEEKEIEILMKYFRNSGLTEEQLRANNRKFNLNEMLLLVKQYFSKLYGYNGGNIILSNRYQRSVNSYIFMDGEREQFVHVDELFEVSILSFFLVVFKWSKEFENKDIYGDCFLYLLFLFNDVSILGKVPNGEALDSMFKILDGDVQIMNLASTCYWAVVIFNLAHEIAHAFFANSGKKIVSNRKEEFEADAIAYDILLNIIIDQKNLDEDKRTIEEYAYLAPMMYMLYFDLFYYTDRVLYNKMITTDTHPLPKDRIDRLFALPYKDKYDFNTWAGNQVYGAFLDSYDEYRTELLLKKENGKLDKIIRTEERKMRDRK